MRNCLCLTLSIGVVENRAVRPVDSAEASVTGFRGRACVCLGLTVSVIRPQLFRSPSSGNRRDLAYTQCDTSNCSAVSVAVMTLQGQLIRTIHGADFAAWGPRGQLLYPADGPAWLGSRYLRAVRASHQVL
jgi:hypothetical protein